ncbi:hypothetical protein L1785_08320 [Antribacter sp. KLBMP9083]|uniref:Uncharacterized protein n=1 Tax=Antribacter soli TaxID=2910976 RepID=A0AA41QF72_9MICO|nr:hypothetical protein [Antribacter soli]MCF4120984.1 hypothetical protein [Antribacter soli]
MPADLRRQWQADAAVRPSPLDQRTATAYDAIALEAAVGYDAVLLSPVTPLGTTSVVSPTSQDRAVTTTRGTEVVSDPTNVLAIEAAGRLAIEPRAHVRLTTVHQTLRPGPVQPVAGRTAHFRLFALAEAGRGEPEDGFEVHAVAEQLAVHLRTIHTAADRFGLQAGVPEAIVCVDEAHARLGDRVSARLTAMGLAVTREPLFSGYYGGLRVRVRVPDPAGNAPEIVDVGAFDWVAQLTHDRRHRFIASALGLQLLPLCYARAQRS